MPGANYMGGKRNAARARVKDATGKVQRNHFGKKRFEILRTGLSKGQATTSHAQRSRSGLNARHEISLAHAHRTVGEPTDDTQTWLPDAYDSSPAIGDAHSTPASAPSRSRILGVLDAENPVAQRAQVDKILQMPDLLGLSTSRQRSSSSPVYYREESIFYPDERAGYESCEPKPLAIPTPDTSPVCYFATHGGRDGFPQPFSLSFDGESAATSSSSPRRHRSPAQHHFPYSRHDPAFVPMYLDSSPSPRVADSERAEYWPGLCRDRWPSEATLCEPHKPTRMPFYSSHPSPVLARSPLDRQLSTSRLSGNSVGSTPGSPRPSPVLHSRGSFRFDVSQHNMPIAVSYEVPITSPNGHRPSLPPSDSCRFSWSGSTSYLMESDVPQASFSLSPSAQVVLQGFASTCASSEGSECSVGATPDSENYMAPIHPLVDTTLGDPSDHWQRISLAELLGGALFENADPWKALDEVLHLGPPDSHQGNASDLLALVETCDTFSAGHDPPPCCFSQASRVLEVEDPERPTPDSTLEMATSGDVTGGRSVERGAQVTDADRLPIDRARDSCSSGAVPALVEVGSNSERPPRCEQSDGPPAKASSPGSDPHASPTQSEAPVELRGDDDGPARMVMSRQGISPLHDNAEAYDALPLASGRAVRDDRGVSVIGDHALVDGPSLFSDFEDFESEEEYLYGIVLDI